MIELTKLNDIKFTVNADLIEFVEETPDTVVSLATGKKIIVKESRQQVAELVILYKRAIYQAWDSPVQGGAEHIQCTNL